MNLTKFSAIKVLFCLYDPTEFTNKKNPSRKIEFMIN